MIDKAFNRGAGNIRKLPHARSHDRANAHGDSRALEEEDNKVDYNSNTMNLFKSHEDNSMVYDTSVESLNERDIEEEYGSYIDAVDYYGDNDEMEADNNEEALSTAINDTPLLSPATEYVDSNSNEERYEEVSMDDELHSKKDERDVIMIQDSAYEAVETLLAENDDVSSIPSLNEGMGDSPAESYIVVESIPDDEMENNNNSVDPSSDLVDDISNEEKALELLADGEELNIVAVSELDNELYEEGVVEAQLSREDEREMVREYIHNALLRQQQGGHTEQKYDEEDESMKKLTMEKSVLESEASLLVVSSVEELDDESNTIRFDVDGGESREFDGEDSNNINYSMDADEARVQAVLEEIDVVISSPGSEGVEDDEIDTDLDTMEVDDDDAELNAFSSSQLDEQEADVSDDTLAAPMRTPEARGYVVPDKKIYGSFASWGSYSIAAADIDYVLSDSSIVCTSHVDSPTVDDESNSNTASGDNDAVYVQCHCNNCCVHDAEVFVFDQTEDNEVVTKVNTVAYLSKKSITINRQDLRKADVFADALWVDTPTHFTAIHSPHILSQWSFHTDVYNTWLQAGWLSLPTFHWFISSSVQVVKEKLPSWYGRLTHPKDEIPVSLYFPRSSLKHEQTKVDTESKVCYKELMIGHQQYMQDMWSNVKGGGKSLGIVSLTILLLYYI